MSGPSWILPSPPNGVVGAPAADLESQQATFYGEDIWFDLATPDESGEPDYVIDPAGDFQMAEGLEALRQSLLRRLITAPGEWTTLPDYGVGAAQYVKQRNTPAMRAELEARIRSQFMQDDRVESVSTVEIVNLNDDPGALQITVQVIAAGRTRQDAPLPVQITLTS